MRAMFSMDGKQWMYADAFGVTRMELGKKRGVTKHTIKLSNPAGSLSMSQSGKLGLHTGHEQTGAYGNDALVGYGLPGLGVKLKLTERRPAGLFTCAAGDRVALLDGQALTLHTIDAAKLAHERAASLTAAPALPALALGPAPDALRRRCATTPRLRVLPDGRYAALTDKGQLVAGKLSDAAYNDEDWWRLALEADPAAEVSLEIVGEDVWVSVMDHAADTAHVARISKAGAVATWAVKSLCAPAPTATHLYTQPDSHTLHKLALDDLRLEASFDVTAHNVHPRPDHDDEVYKGSPRPPRPTRLPGYLSASNAAALFVPWHAEFFVDLGDMASFQRGLDPAPGAFRRLIQEIVLRDNEALAANNLRVTITQFDHNAKYSSSPLRLMLPPLYGSALTLTATYAMGLLHSRYELRAGGWGWGSMGGDGGAHWAEQPITLEDARAALELMRRADWLPFEVTDLFTRIYAEQLGIPSEPSKGPAKLAGEPERLFLRAMLETVKACGWPVKAIPDAWASEPISPALIDAAIDRFERWDRYVPYDGTQAFTMLLTSHLGVDAIPHLLRLAEDFPTPLNWQQYRHTGEMLVWLCRRHPAHKDATLKAWRAIKHPASSSFSNEKSLVEEALKRGAKHLWSNG